MGFGHGSDLAGRSTSRRMRVLGIETTCDETAAAVVRLRPDGAGEILADEVMSQIAAHAPFGGVVPEIAARAHVEIIDLLIARALARAGVAARDSSLARAIPSVLDSYRLGAIAPDQPLVRSRRLELPRVAPQRPQRCASTNSATTARGEARGLAERPRFVKQRLDALAATPFRSADG